jgi:hypothetical protein
VALRLDLTFDCADAETLAEFWKAALAYEDEPPPPPFTTRAEWVASFDLPDDDGGGAWLRDPDGIGPRLTFLEVPEPKTAKNRLHIDVRVGEGPGAWSRISAKVTALEEAGGRVLTTIDGHHVVMADPEGNEFCVAA